MYELRIKKEGSTTTLAVLLALLLSKMRKNEKKSVRERENLETEFLVGGYTILVEKIFLTTKLCRKMNPPFCQDCLKRKKFEL